MNSSSNPMHTSKRHGNVVFWHQVRGHPSTNKLLDQQASDIGKGANSTISYIHNFFKNHGLGETCVHLHTDNCSGQNKNNYFI